MISHRAALSELRNRLVPLPEDFLDRLEQPIGSYLSHTERRVLAVALGQLLPGFDSSAVSSNTTGEQILYWLERYDPESAPTPLPRGAYRSRNCFLRVLTDSDLGPLYQSALEPSVAHRWRFRGSTPSPEAFRAALFSPDVLVQHAVVANKEPYPLVGLVTAYEADHSGGHCFVAFHRTAQPANLRQATSGLLLEGLALLVEYIFDHFDFHKIYVELPEYNLSLISDTFILHQEGQLRDHFFAQGRHWDAYIFAAYRSEFADILSRFRPPWPHSTDERAEEVGA